MREIVHLQAGQCGNQIGSKVRHPPWSLEGPGKDQRRHVATPQGQSDSSPAALDEPRQQRPGRGPARPESPFAPTSGLLFVRDRKRCSENKAECFR